MTPQEQAQAVMTAYHDAPIVGVFPRSADAIGVAAAIRAAVDLLLPEEPGPEWSDPSRFVAAELMERFYERLCVREELLAIAAELEGPANG
jgi:hypothetical protein